MEYPILGYSVVKILQENKMENENRPCEICGKSDMPTMVVSSSIGAFSMNYCSICAAMGAEQLGFQKEYNCNSYNTNDDMYYDKSDNHIPIKTNSGLVFNTRSEYIEHIRN